MKATMRGAVWGFLVGMACMPAAQASLAGTQWRLAVISSMSDEQPPLRPDDPTRYRLAFDADGQARLQLDCNRGRATWQAQPGTPAEPARPAGALQFGPLASTRAACAPGSLAPRLAAALPYVRGYVIEGGLLHLSLMADGGILSWAPTDDERQAAVQGRIAGSRAASHRIQGAAGQVLQLSLQASNGAQQINLLAPGAREAMLIGASTGTQATLLLPTDGEYTVQTYLMRSAARRQERSRYTLRWALGGAPLRPLPAAQDARLPGTPYHARSELACHLPYGAGPTRCDAAVVRRGRDGTATVELRLGEFLRRVLFVAGRPVASDSAQPLTSTRQGDITTVRIGDDERHEVPDALLTGG